MQEYKLGDEEFEIFTSYRGKFTPKISITKPGVISFSSGMNNRYNLENYKAVELSISKDRKKIAFKFTEEEKEGTVGLRERGAGGKFVAAKSFIAKYALEGYYGRGFVPEEINHPEKGLIFLIRLDQEMDNDEKSG
jgi:hypothetical protein